MDTKYYGGELNAQTQNPIKHMADELCVSFMYLEIHDGENDVNV